MPRSINVAAAVILSSDRVLSAQRGHGDLAGGWEFPGGKVEPGETAEQACVREIQEELGVRVCGLEPFVALEYDNDDFHMHLDTFACSIADGEGPITLSDHLGMRWLAADELDQVAWLPADAQVANALKAYLATTGSFTATTA